jgi:galactokinase/mevalonate kinase-like predicted kinase
MFSQIVLTAPNEKIAAVFRSQLQHLLNEHKCKALQFAKIHCFADPAGVRIGSGGGTLHAIASLLKVCGISNLSQEKVLIVHSGGDARRSPMYSVCGKAWMSLNIDARTSKNEYQCIVNALLLLLEHFNGIATKCPVGSLVVASSDVLLSLAKDWNNIHWVCEGDKVYVITVPARAATAKNHGVLHSSTLDALSEDSDVRGEMEQMVDRPVDIYLQKPSIEVMQARNILLRHSDKHASESALVDTGLVIFTGSTLQSLINLCSSVLVDQSTTNGIPSSYNYLRFELYTELLLACNTTANRDFTFDQYLESLGIVAADLSERMRSGLELIWQSFHQYPLHLLCFPTGSFLHLGTSREVFDLLVGNYSTLSHVHFKNISQSMLGRSADNNNNTGVRCLNSLLMSAELDNAKVYIEHSLVDTPTRLHNCFLSHIVHHEIIASLPSLSQFLLQEVPIVSHNMENLALPLQRDAMHYCLLSLHLDDNTKAATTIGGVVFAHFLEKTGTAAKDLWASSVPESERTIWNANLFPVYSSTIGASRLNAVRRDGVDSSPVFLANLLHLCAQESNDPSKLLHVSHAWRQSYRVSLSYLLANGDAEALFLWREMIASFVQLQARFETADEFTLPRQEFESFLQIFRQWQQLNRDASLPSFASMLLSMQLLSRFLSVFSADDLREYIVCCYPSLAAGAVDELLSLCMTYVQSVAEKNNFLRRSIFDEDWRMVLRMFFLRSVGMIEPLDFLHNVLFVHRLLQKHVRAKSLPRYLLALSQIMTKFDLASNFHAVCRFSPLQTASHSAPSLVVDVDLQATMHETFEHVSLLLLNLQKQYASAVEPSTAAPLFSVSKCLEDLAQQVTQRDIEISLHVFEAAHTKASDQQQPPSIGSLPQVVVSRAPVRIDLAGGWSDTPPICFDQAGAVFNVAVSVDGKKPLRCVAAFVEDNGTINSNTDEGVIILECWRRRNQNVNEFEIFASESCAAWSSLTIVAQSESACALPKACVLLLLSLIAKRNGIALHDSHHSAEGTTTTPNVLSRILHSLPTSSPTGVGIKVICLSDLPTGSGMGGSSILAGVILHAVAHLLGLTEFNESALVYMVSQVEQLMTTGGGWQDQVGGLFPGFKIARSPALLPLVVEVETIPARTGHRIQEVFDQMWHARCCLVYTGQQRLAKDTLINALRKYSLLCTDSNPTIASSSSCSHGGGGGGGDDDDEEYVAHDLIQRLIGNAEEGFRHLNTTLSQTEEDSTAATMEETIHNEIDYLAHVVQT